MNTLVRCQLNHWNPFREMEELQSHLDSILGVAPSGRLVNGDGTAAATWAPRVDILEDDKEYLIKVDLPEVRREDLQLTVERGILTLRGERKPESDDAGKQRRRVERAYGSFLRQFALPEDIDAAKVNAEFKHGVLRIHMGKSEKAQPRSITIQTA